MTPPAGARVRAATAADADAIAAVHVRSWQHAYRGLMPAAALSALSVQQRAQDWRHALLAGCPQVLVAQTQGDGVAGFCSQGPSRDAGAAAATHELWTLYVDPPQAGRGIGRRLWQCARDGMLDAGAQRVTLWVIVGNDVAADFYRGCGFEPEPSSRQAFELAGATLFEERHVFEAAHVAPADLHAAALAPALQRVLQRAQVQESRWLGQSHGAPLPAWPAGVRGWCAWLGGALAGALAMTPDAGADAAAGAGPGHEVATLVVDPDAQRRGVGRQLLRAALRATAGPVTVLVAEGNAPALSLYASLGFLAVRRGLMGEAALPVLQLRRPAAAP